MKHQLGASSFRDVCTSGGSDETALGYVGRGDGYEAVTDKAYYQAAAAEVADGVIDRALWIKVNAELPGTSDAVRQAKYIQLRAEELAHTARSMTISRFIPSTERMWVLYVLVAFAVALMFGGATNSSGVSVIVLIAAILAGGVLNSKYGVKNPTATDAKPAAPSAPPPSQPAPMLRLPRPKVEQNTSTKEANPEKTSPSLPAGDYGLAKTYWLFQTIPAFIASIVLRNLTPPVAMFGLVVFIFYEIFALPGVWNAATYYEGLKLWAVIAKIAVIGTTLSLALSVLVFTSLVVMPGPTVEQTSATSPTSASYLTAQQIAAAAPMAVPAAKFDYQATYDRKVANLEQRYPEINPDSPHFNQALVNRISAKLDILKANGAPLSDALEQAVTEVMSSRKRKHRVPDESNSKSSRTTTHPSQPCNYDSVMSDAQMRACGSQ